MAFTSDFLIVWLEETGQRRGTHEVQNSHYWNFSVGIYKKISITQKIRDLSHLREATNVMLLRKCFNEHGKKLNTACLDVGRERNGSHIDTFYGTQQNIVT